MAAARLKCYSLDKCNKMIQCGNSGAAGLICACTPGKARSRASGCRVKGLSPPAGKATADGLRTTTHPAAAPGYSYVTLPPAGPCWWNAQSVLVCLASVCGFVCSFLRLGQLRLLPLCFHAACVVVRERFAVKVRYTIFK